jgi:hypothetical protein
MFNNEFYQLCDKLSQELDNLFGRYPELHPDYRVPKFGDAVFSIPSGQLVSFHRPGVSLPIGIAISDAVNWCEVIVTSHGVIVFSTDGFNKGDTIYLST